MNRKQTACQVLAQHESALQEMSRWLYQNPETAYREFESSRRLAELLGANGFEVTYPAYDLETAFEATAGSSGPRVVICCEYDALPEVGHACGHNIIATAAIGAGIALADMTEELGIRVTVLGTPAEEGGGGKVKLIDAGAFEDAAASMMIHPLAENLINKSFQSRQTFYVEYQGKESHAALAPHLGVNALDAFVQAYLNVSTLRQHYMAGDRTHCIVTNGGDASNIIPAYTKSTWGIRAASRERLEVLMPKVRACWEAAAQATGCRLTVTPAGEPYYDVIHNPVMTSLFGANSTTLGRPMPSEVVAEGGSTDMGNVSQVVPSIHPMLAIETNGAVNHQKEFTEATITESGDLALHDGALAMAYTIIDMAEQDVWDRL